MIKNRPTQSNPAGRLRPHLGSGAAAPVKGLSTMELTKQVLKTVRATIEDQWSVERGCSFTVADGRGVKWDVDVPSCNKWDCWAIKQGTQGRQFRTFQRFDGRGE